MTLSLQPQANFTVVRQIANHLDTDINYVRAVIRNAYTDDIITTLDLVDKGSQRFKKDWQVPADTSGQGFYISIVTSVYTDSGYTTKNSNYGDEETTYLVQDRLLGSMRGGGGGVDAYTVRRIIKEELAQLPQPEPIEFPEQEKYDMRWDEVLKAIEAKTFEQKDVDLNPVLSALKEAKQAIADKEVTPPADLYAMEREVAILKEFVERKLGVMESLLQDNPQEVVNLLGPDITKKLEEIVNDVEFSIAPSNAKMSARKEKEQAQPVPFDLSKLTT